MIKCNTCGLDKEETEFYSYTPTVKHKRGAHKACKQCVRETQQKFRRENKEYYTSQSKERYTNTKLKAIEYKGGKCIDCGNTYPHYVYDFHHEDPKEKDHKWTLGRSWEKLKDELDKCVLLCANCHRVRHWQ